MAAYGENLMATHTALAPRDGGLARARIGLNSSVVRLAGRVGSAAGQLLKLLERFGLEQRAACCFACAARLGTDRAMTMMIGVPGALLGTARADTHADLEQAVDDVVVGMGGSRQDPRGDCADVGAVLIERDACAHLFDVLLPEVRVRTRGTRLDAVQASVDRGGDVLGAELHARRRGIQH